MHTDITRYPKELLQSWKQLAEQTAILEVETTSSTPAFEKDKELVQFYLECFDRPAFQDDIYQEGRMEDFDKAIEDTLIALNTGVLRTRDGSILKQADGKSSIQNSLWREKLYALMEQEVAVCMTNFARIMNELNNAFSWRNEVVDRLCGYPLLIIDDFGMERGTEYALEQIYNIIDSRYRSRKPLIVTTNLTLTELKNPQDTAHARIYDRLLELCTPIACTGPSMRKDIGQAKLNLLKTLLT